MYLLVVTTVPVVADDGPVITTGQVEDVARLEVDEPVSLASLNLSHGKKRREMVCRFDNGQVYAGLYTFQERGNSVDAQRNCDLSDITQQHEVLKNLPHVIVHDHHGMAEGYGRT